MLYYMRFQVTTAGHRSAAEQINKERSTMSIGISMERVDEIIDSYGALRHQLIAIMQDIQAEY